MSKTETKSPAAGCGWVIAVPMGIVFVVLKLTGVIAWSWLWVLAPFWIPIVIFAVVCIVAGVILVYEVAKGLK